MTDAPWLDDMLSSVGVREVAGDQAEARILGYFADVGHPECKSDEIAWCAARVGSALVNAGLPIPSVNVNLLARSYLTYGEACEPKPGAIVVFPRGNSSWQGHVGCVVEVKGDKVKYVAGNQSDMVGYGTSPINKALGFRWPVAPTVAALRAAGSTEIKKADQVQNVGTAAGGLSIGAAVVETLMGPIGAAPVHKDPAAALTFWQSLIKGIDGAWQLIIARPWLVFLVVGGLGAWWVGKRLKASRVAKHKEGAPLSKEVVEVNARGEVPA